VEEGAPLLDEKPVPQPSGRKPRLRWLLSRSSERVIYAVCKTAPAHVPGFESKNLFVSLFDRGALHYEEGVRSSIFAPRSIAPRHPRGRIGNHRVQFSLAVDLPAPCSPKVKMKLRLSWHLDPTRRHRTEFLETLGIPFATRPRIHRLRSQGYEAVAIVNEADG